MFGFDFDQKHDPDGYSDFDLDRILAKVVPDDKPQQPPRRGKSGKPKITLEEVDERIRKAYNGRMVRTTTYHGRFSPLTCKCTACGEEVYKRRAEGFFRGYWTFCKCSRKAT